jgi:hypothetical protein
MERAEYNRHSRARMAETAKDASRHTAPDARERIPTGAGKVARSYRRSKMSALGTKSLACTRFMATIVCRGLTPSILSSGVSSPPESCSRTEENS